MFNWFSQSQGQNKLSRSMLRQIQSEFKEMMNHINAAMKHGLENNPLGLEPIDARKIYRKIDLELQTAQYHFKNVMDIWPRGKPVFNELYKFFDYYKQFNDNLWQWSELVHLPDFDIYKSSDRSKYHHYVARNRKLGDKLDSQYIKANSRLKELTGIELLPLYEEPFIFFPRFHESLNFILLP